MKKIFLPLVITMIILSGCSVPLLQKAGWAVPSLTALGALIFGILTYKETHSGQNIYNPKTDGTYYTHDNLPLKKSKYLIYTIACTLATIGILLWMNYDK